MKIDESNWREFLILNSRGEGLKRNSMQNVYLILKFESERLGKFWMEGDVVHTSHGDWRPEKGPGEMTETDYTALQGWLEYAGLEPTEKNLKKAVKAVAMEANSK